MSSIRRLLQAMMVAFFAVSCGPAVDESTGVSGSTTGPSGSTVAGPTGTSTPHGGTDTSAGTSYELASLLLIVDNSVTMPPRQAKLADAVAVLGSALDSAGVDYRIAVTTTDSGNSFWCPTSTPERGAFVMSSCLARPEDFTIGALEKDPTCVEQCDVDQVKLRPTHHSADDNDEVRPWIEVREGASNLDNASLAQALPCVLLQGLKGCGFEQPLESMLLAIERTQDPLAPEFGFFGPGTLPVVVILTDELDCSFNPEDEEALFSPEGPRTFWELPDRPTSALCWNAGVSCDEEWDCGPAYVDSLGEPVPPSQAVMRPVDRYADVLSELEMTVGGDALLTAIVGAGPDGSIAYGPAGDPAVQDEYGAGLACGEPFVDPGVPSVRIRELVEARGGSLHSVCADSYEPAMQALASGVIDRMAGR